MDIIGLIFAATGSFYAGYQRGRRVQDIQDSKHGPRESVRLSNQGGKCAVRGYKRLSP